jgi:predicted ATPase
MLEEGLMRSDLDSRDVILSGCSGGGKSTLLAELARRGFETVLEPGRSIVTEELRGGGKALPWINLEAFAKRAIEMALLDRERMKGAKGWVFYDRGLVDAAVALEYAARIPSSDTLRGTRRFHRQVFLAPPWPEIYRTDGERRHDMEEGVGEYHRLLSAFDKLGYETIILPKADVRARADFVLDCLS